MRHLVAMLFSFVYGYFTCTLISNINVHTLKGRYYPSFFSEFLFVSAQEVHKDSRDPFKACEELGPKGPGAETARLRVVFAGTSSLIGVKVKAAYLFRVVVSKTFVDIAGTKWAVLLRGNFKCGK